MPALPFPYTDLLPALPEPVAPKLPCEPVPEVITEVCPHCEEGGVLVGQGEAWEHYEPCAVCLGDWQRTRYLCEISDPPHYVSEHEMTADSICLRCHEKGKQHLECERAKHETWLAEEISWALSVGLVTREQVES